MRLKNVVEQSKKVKVNEKYDISYKEMLELLKEYGDKPVDLLYASFRIGYQQGIRAEKARAKRRNRHE